MQFLYYFLDLSSQRAFNVHPSRNIFFLLIFSSFSLSVLRYLQTKYFPFQNIFLHFLLCFTSQQTNIVFQIIGPFPSQLFSYPNKKYFSSANNCFLLLRTKYFPSLNIFSFLFFFSSKKLSIFFSFFFSVLFHHSPYQVCSSFPPFLFPSKDQQQKISCIRVKDQLADLYWLFGLVICRMSCVKKYIARIANAVQVTV